MNQRIEIRIHHLSYHFSSWNKSCIEFMKNILQVISFRWIFCIKQVHEFLHKLRCNIVFQYLWISKNFMSNNRMKELVYPFNKWPGRINFTLINDSTCLSSIQINIIEARQWSENVLLNHFHDLIKIRQYYGFHCLIIIHHRLNHINSIKSLSLSFDVLACISIIICFQTNHYTFYECFFCVHFGAFCSFALFGRHAIFFGVRLIGRPGDLILSAAASWFDFLLLHLIHIWHVFIKVWFNFKIILNFNVIDWRYL